ncbi:MAG: hypothetical protein H0T71_14270 [Acidobacteria bacterium]|nr:hypothetical protein [Acidobacteriota bacterium]
MQYGAIPESLVERLALTAGLVPIPMMDAMFGMLKSRFVMAGVKLGIFEALASEPGTAESLAAALELDGPSLELLLRSLVFAGYLELDGGHYRLSAMSRKSMVSGAPRELTGFVMWNYTQWQYTEHLELLLQTGRGVDFHSTLQDAEAWGYYQKGMLEGARFNAPVLAKHVPVRKGATTLLDLAGSHGLMGAAICRKHPPMRSTVIELPAAVTHARTLAEREGINDIVDHRSGDVMTEALGSGADVVLLSNILHHFLPDQIGSLLERVHQSLNADGTVAIWELERPNRDSKPSGGDGIALFFRITSTASTYSGDEYAGWLTQAGFSRVKIVRPRLSPGSVIVHARR